MTIPLTTAQDSFLVTSRYGKVYSVLLMNRDGVTTELRGAQMLHWLNESLRAWLATQLGESSQQTSLVFGNGLVPGSLERARARAQDTAQGAQVGEKKDNG